MSDPEQAVVQQFYYLTKRSQEYFHGLREFPPTSPKKIWYPYFQRCFELFTQLWNLQQEHRALLEKRANLKRKEIGEIATKIAQLYYHYYLRTSDTKYLQEAFVFYDAVRSRQYFKSIWQDLDSAASFNKLLRFYARFIVVCLLQNRRELVINYLLKEWRDFAKLYADTFKDTSFDWTLVCSELETFLKHDTRVRIAATNDNTSYRMESSLLGSNTMTLSEAILICSKKQIKFSELTFDMYRMMQATEKNQPKNPKKTVLYKPCATECIGALSNAMQDGIDASQVLVVYMSAEASSSGLVLTSKKNKEEYWSWNDMYPFSRHPMLVILETDNPTSMMPKNHSFDNPLLCLAAPQQPMEHADIMTSFLTNPVFAMCKLQHEQQIHLSIEEYKSLHYMLDQAMLLLIPIVQQSLPSSMAKFLENEYTRMFLLRYLVCIAVVKQAPVTFPKIDDEPWNGMIQVLAKPIAEIQEVIANKKSS